MAVASPPWQRPRVPTNYFDEPVAARYDADSSDMFAPEVLDPALDFLHGLAGGGATLELGVGTGRLALPLSRRGVRMHGIDLSPAMIDQLRGKPGAEDIGLTVGDFATTRVPGAFRLAYLAFNTITNLTTQEEQVACFGNVAVHLDHEVSALQRLPPGEVFRIFHRSANRLSFDEYDVATQLMYSHHYRFHDGSYDLVSIPFRYVWPAELDLMARLAGMRLRERWSDWIRTPFTSDSASHVSVWQKV